MSGLSSENNWPAASAAFVTWSAPLPAASLVYLCRLLRDGVPNLAAEAPEVSLGHVLEAAIADGLDVQSVRFPRGSFVDLGAPEGLRHVVDGCWEAGRGAGRRRRSGTRRHSQRR